MLKYMLIKHKQIFQCFNYFWKVFILKIFKNFKNCATLSWQLASWVKPVTYLSREFIQKVFTTHWQVKVLVAKKTQKFFQKSGFLDFSRLSLVTCSQVEAPIARFTQNVSRLPSRLSRRWNFQSRKTLRQILPIFVSRLLATCLRRFLQLTGRSRSQLRKTFRKIFKNLGFQISRNSVW